MLWKCCTQYVSKFGKLSSGHSMEEVSFHSGPKKRQCQRMFKVCTITLISHASRVMRTDLQARLQQYMNWELSDVQAGFRKGRGTRDQIAKIQWTIRKESSRKTSTSVLLTMPKLLNAWIPTNCGKFLRIPDHLTCLLRNLYAGQEATVRTGHGTTDLFQVDHLQWFWNPRK